MSPDNPSKATAALAALLLVVVTCGAYAPVCWNGFTWWDDHHTIHQNPNFSPPSGEKIARYWRAPEQGLYAPVTFTLWGGLSYVAEKDRSDAEGIHHDPKVYHVASLVLHVASVLVVFAILRMLSRRVWAAFAGALLFALHPVQVESVAWASGMKDVLCGLLALCAVHQYLVFAQEANPKRWAYYGSGAVVLVLALLAKPSAMVVPVVVAVLDLWVIRRPSKSVAVSAGIWGALVVPFAIVARVAQTTELLVPAPWWQRPLIAADAVTFYLYKLLWPVTLAPDYARRPGVVSELWGGAWLWLVWVVPVGLGVVLWRGRRTRPWPLAAGLLFVAAILPMLGFAPFQFQYMSTVADHYLYLAMFGPGLALTWALVRFHGRAVTGAAGVAFALLAARTTTQIGHWRDDAALWTHTMAVSPRSFVAPNNIAANLGRQSAVFHTLAVDAQEQGKAALADKLEGMRREKLERAVPLLEASCKIFNDYLPARHNAFVYYLRLGDDRRAVGHLEEMVRINANGPEHLRKQVPKYHETAGMLWMRLGEYAKAAAHYDRLAAIDPAHKTARKNLEDAQRRLAGLERD